MKEKKQKKKRNKYCTLCRNIIEGIPYKTPELNKKKYKICSDGCWSDYLKILEKEYNIKQNTTN